MPLSSFVFFPLLLFSATAPAAELRKCVGATGAVSYQSLPCAKGSRQVWSQPIKPASVPPRPGPRGKEPAMKPPSVRASGPPVQRSDQRRASEAQARRLRCEQARRKADEVRDRLWNKLDFQQRSDLDAKVARACARRRK